MEIGKQHDTTDKMDFCSRQLVTDLLRGSYGETGGMDSCPGYFSTAFILNTNIKYKYKSQVSYNKIQYILRHSAVQ